MAQDAQTVWYNDGTNPNCYALVERDREDNVPQREPDDYGQEGGGVTWHSSRI